MRRDGWRARVLWIPLFFFACKEDFDESCTPGTEACTCAENDMCFASLECVSNTCVALGDGDGDGDGDGELELLENGGFETWEGGTPLFWMPTGALAVTEGTPQTGELGAELSASRYASLRQSRSVDLPSGTVLVFEFAYMYIEGEEVQPGVDIYAIEEGTSDPVIVSNFSTGAFGPEWTSFEGNVVLPFDTVGVDVLINLGGFGMQTVAIDDVSLTAD